MVTEPMGSLVDAMESEELFLPLFRDRASWAPWKALLRAIFGEPLTPDELAIYRRLTGRDQPPTNQVKEVWVIAGRRAGKSRIASVIAVWLAVAVDYSGCLAPGERGVVQVLAADRPQAKLIFGYIKGLFNAVDLLRPLVERETADTLDLTNGISIEVTTSSFRSLRGRSVVAALADEVAFWLSDEDGSNPDVEVFRALRPAMSLIPNALLVAISSPYKKAGALWLAHRDHYGREGDPVLVVQADSRSLNPSLPQAVVDRAYAEDPAAAAAEYGGQFREDVGSFLSSELIDRAVEMGRAELPPVGGVFYQAHCDPAGGSGKDSMTLAIAHEQDGLYVVDGVWAVRPPFSTEEVVARFADILKSYGCGDVYADRYAGAWVADAFARHEIRHRPAAMSTSELYLAVEPLFSTGRVRLPDDGALLAELRNLERKTTRGHRDTVSHPRSGHDDRCTAMAGALYLVSKTGGAPLMVWTTGGGGRAGEDSPERYVTDEETGQKVDPAVLEGLWGR